MALAFRSDFEIPMGTSLWSLGVARAGNRIARNACAGSLCPPWPEPLTIRDRFASSMRCCRSARGSQQQRTTADRLLEDHKRRRARSLHPASSSTFQAQLCACIVTVEVTRHTSAVRARSFALTPLHTSPSLPRTCGAASTTSTRSHHRFCRRVA